MGSCTCNLGFDPECLECWKCPQCCECGGSDLSYDSAAEEPWDTSQDSAYGSRGDAHIGEASHPGPRSVTGYAPCMFPSWGFSGTLVKTLVSLVAVLSICDGMGCAAMALKNCSADIDRYVAVEIDDKARYIAQFANPKGARFPGIDHYVCNNMYDLTEQDVVNMGVIGLFIGATPCGDFSMLRLLPNRNSKEKGLRWATIDPRPGLDGPNGDKFRQLIQILAWVVKHNPNCEYFIENLYFNDMVNDWEEICGALGVPIRVNAQDYSRTKRNRPCLLEQLCQTDCTATPN